MTTKFSAIAWLVVLLLSACQTAELSLVGGEIGVFEATQPAAAATAQPEDAGNAEMAQPRTTLMPFPELATEADDTEAETNALRPISYNPPLALAPQDHFYFSFPVAVGALTEPLPSAYYGDFQVGSRRDGHTGLDVVLDVGTPILAAGAGTVVWSGYGLLNDVERINDPYGMAVVIRHDFGHKGQSLYTVYAHLSSSEVQLGQRVEQGEVIGLSGNSGLSSGPHLHVEVRVGENTRESTRNPELWLAPPEGWGVLVGQVETTLGQRLLSHPVVVTNLDTGAFVGAITYLTENHIVEDDYFDENFVLGDLPAGRYEVSIAYLASVQTLEVEIRPGGVTFFRFQGYDGFSTERPEGEAVGNLPDASPAKVP